jgi:hypothetical protein
MGTNGWRVDGPKGPIQPSEKNLRIRWLDKTYYFGSLSGESIEFSDFL